jgi:YggT family protein
MSTMIDIILFLIKVFGSLYLTVIILRFLLQTARADFYNPISQTLVKLTNPVLIPLRKVIPGFFGIDLASIVLALVFHYVVMQLLVLVAGGGLQPPHYMFGWSIIGVALHTIQLYIMGGFVLFISSFIAPFSRQPALLLVRQLLDPLMRPVQRLIPATGGLDFSLFFVGILLIIARMIIRGMGSEIGTPFQFLIGFNI